MIVHRFTSGQDSRELYTTGKVRNYRVAYVEQVTTGSEEVLWVTLIRQTLKGTDYKSGEYLEFPITDESADLADIIAYVKETIMCMTCDVIVTQGIPHTCKSAAVSRMKSDKFQKFPFTVYRETDTHTTYVGMVNHMEHYVIERKSKHVDETRAVDQPGTVIPLDALITHHGSQLINALNWNNNWRTFELLCERVANKPLAAVS